MAILTLYVQRPDDPQAHVLLRRLCHQGYRLDGLLIERVFRLEGKSPPDVDSLRPLFVNTLYERAHTVSQLLSSGGPIVEVGYQPAVIDPETHSILDGARAMGDMNLDWVRLGYRYQFIGADAATAERIVSEQLFNKVVQMIIPPDFPWKVLQPSGTPPQIQRISFLNLSDEQLRQLSYEYQWQAPLSQLQALQQQEQDQARPFTQSEVEIVLQSWCDHCYHTSWKQLGLFDLLHSATRRIKHPLVVSVFSDNAGAMRFYDGWAITIKGETHCYPSASATYGGIMTKHGGIIRDTSGFGLGAYPIGGSTIMGTMDPRISAQEVPAGALHPRIIVMESIRGTSDYCNPMGIPMMLPQYRIHPGYPKCFALGHSIGIIPEAYALKQEPQPGDIALLFGGRTGRDGIHGATLSSSGLQSTEMARSAASVQIGHPIVERNFVSAIPVLRDSGCFRHVTDLGAGGISCAAGEQAKHTGIRLDLDSVPLKDTSLSDWEVLLSESQERMLAAVIPEKLQLALEILHSYNVEATIIGEFTDTHRFEAYWRGVKVVGLPMSFIWGSCPIDPIQVKEPERKLMPQTVQAPTDEEKWKKAALAVVSHYHCCDQSAAGFQFDSTVQGRTAIGPYAGIDGNMPTNVFVSVPLRGKPYGTVFTAAYNPFYGEVNPAGLGRLMVVEAVAKAMALGVNLDELVLCDNFYTPKLTPEIGWCLKTLVHSAIEFAAELGLPFVSGKDSSSGTFVARNGKKTDVPYTFVCSLLARVPDVHELITKPFKRAGNRLVLVGDCYPDQLGGSVYLDCHGERGDSLPDLGLPWAYNLRSQWQGVNAAHSKRAFRAASAVAEGGLFLRLFEMALGSGLGAMIDLRSISDGRLDGILFGEHQGNLLFEVDQQFDLHEFFPQLTWCEIGRVIEEPALDIRAGGAAVFTMPVAELRSAWSKTFEEVVR